MNNISSLWWECGDLYEISATGVDSFYNTIGDIGRSRMASIGNSNISDTRMFRTSGIGSDRSRVTLTGSTTIGSIG